MQLTIETLFNDPNVVKAVIDRVQAMGLDEIYWKRYFDFEQTPSRVFKTYIGTVMGVVAGTIIDKNSGRPIRNRKSLGNGVGEVASLGDSYQMDNDRLDMLKSLIDKFNVAKTADQSAAMTTIIDYITDDVRQCLLAPHKKMDLIVGRLRSTGKAEVKLADNKEGIELIDMELPVIILTPTAEQKKSIVSYIKKEVGKLKTKVGKFAVMEMTEETFNKHFATSTEFQNAYKMVLGTAEISVGGGIITSAMANQLLTGVGLPSIRLIEEYITMENGTIVNAFEDDKITLLQSDKLGKMMWHEPYEASDPIPGKTYTRSEGGMYLSNVRTEQGRFMEYGCEWIPSFSNPNRIAIINLA
jgi:hypothetical protein